MTPISSAPAIIENIGQHQLSENRFDRHIRTRVDVMNLFLRVAYRAGAELLYAVAMAPLAAVKLVLNQFNRGHLLAASFNFNEVTAHLKQSKQCAAALIRDFPAIFIDPKIAQTKLFNRQLLPVEIPQPTFFGSLTKHIWTRQAALIGTAAALCATAFAIHRLGRLNPPPIPNPNPPNPRLGLDPAHIILLSVGPPFSFYFSFQFVKKLSRVLDKLESEFEQEKIKVSSGGKEDLRMDAIKKLKKDDWGPLSMLKKIWLNWNSSPIVLRKVKTE